jgi:hypothetical protein
LTRLAFASRKGKSMSAIQGLIFRRWLVGLTFTLAATDIAPAACPSGKRPALVIDSATLNERDVFNVRFKKIDIRACQIWDVIVLLADEIEKNSGGKRHFVVFLESSRTGKYLDKHVPTSQWDVAGPKINFAGSDMTLEAVINALCLKAGWSYDDHTPVGTMFTDSKRLPKPKR